MLTAALIVTSLSLLPTETFPSQGVDHGLQVDKDELFDEIDGVRKFSGVLVARLITENPVKAAQFDPRTLHERRESGIEQLAGLRINRFIEETGEYLVEVPGGETENSLAATLLASGCFDYVEPDWLVSPLGCPNDPQFGAQWHHAVIGSCAAWNYAVGSPAITIAVCDSGVHPTHADLRGNRREGYNSVTRTWESAGGAVSDVYGHGTKVVGCAAATGNNGIGVSGTAWNVSYRPMRITNDADLGLAATSDIVEAIRVAAQAGDKVINISYSGATSASAATNAAYARDLGSLVVWSAGNNGDYLFGDRNDSILVVGATNTADIRTIWSNYGPFVDLVAPGEGILTTSWLSDTAYGTASGTSFAAPIVSGLCALVWSRNPALSPAQVEQIVRGTCVDRGAAGVDEVYGHGRINAAAAMAAVSATQRHTLWASSVPDNASWTDESYAAFAPTCNDCNSSACQYATNGLNSSTAALTGADFDNFVLPPGHRIIKVEVEVSGRYNTNTTANIGFRAFAPAHAIDSGWRNTPNFTSGTLCADRCGATGDITSIHSSWTAAKVNNLQFQIRRKAGLTSNTLRVVSMKIMVTTAPI